ncbi:tobamovirus multiplication 1 isoform X2 [Carex rostrata]
MDEGSSAEVLVLTRRASVVFGEAISDWWKEINESPQWQDTVFYLLSASYALVSAIALIQLIRIQRRVPEFGWTTQKVFHLMNFIVNAVRAIIFGFHAEVFSFKTKVFTLILLDLPGLLFFSTYTLLVLFWAEIYYQANALASVHTDKLRTAYLSVNAVIYAIQVGIWMYLWIDDSYIIELVGKIFIAAVSLLAVLGFVFYGGRLFNLLKRFPIESKGRRKKLHEVGWVTGICFTCFSVRCIMRLFSAFDPDLTLEVLDHPILDLFYYMFTEVVPMALVLFILRKLPPKRVSAQYHPIR